MARTKKADRLQAERRAARLPAIRTVIILDPMGGGDQTDDDEVAKWSEEFRTMLAPRRLTVSRSMYVDPHMQADLVLFDFGGMSPGNDLMGSNSRALLRWLDDHPSSLVVVLSSFTYRNGVLPEMRELGLFVPAEEATSADTEPDIYERERITPILNVMVYDHGVRGKEKVKRWFS